MIDIRDHGVGVGGGSNIKSIQRLTVEPWIYKTLTETDLSISPVKPDNTLILMDYNGNGGADRTRTAVELISENTIRLRRNSTYAYQVNVNYHLQIIEFSNVKSKQTGISTDLADIPISTVDPSKCILYATGTQTATGEIVAYFEEVIRISSENLISFLSASGGKIIYWQLIEFK